MPFKTSHTCTLQSYAFPGEDNAFMVGWGSKGKVWGEISGESLNLELLIKETEFVYGWHKHCFTYDSKKSEFMVCIFYVIDFVLHWHQ